VDTFVGGAGANTVYGTAATLNAGDSLTGGSGNNVLELIGSGSFYVSQLASFTGFQSIKLDNAHVPVIQNQARRPALYPRPSSEIAR
jgi:Ca2+-binding RTX toxin-like protein